MKSETSNRRVVTKNAILESARREIEESGILGLRVAEVAAGANCSITQIYRYFENRDGLLAAVLGDMYQEILDGSMSSYQSTLFTRDNLTVDDVVDSLPTVLDDNLRRRQAMRLQILAAAVNNPRLERRIAEITQQQFVAWNEGLDELERRLAPGETFDRRVFTMMLATTMPYYRVLMGDAGYTDAEFRQFLKEKMRA